ncbi:MAG: ArsR/SmtB family transcription factor [Candidatus Sifarchaeia archaeon]
MSDDIDIIRKELEEVRKLKEELKKEVDDMKALKREEQIKGERRYPHRDEFRRLRDEARRARTSRPPKPPCKPRVARIDLDLEDLTDSLETMMDGLGHQIEMSLKNVDGLKVPGIRIHKDYRRTKRRKEERREIESIAPERVAAIVAPLGSEERLKILDYLKTGGKSFNDIENFTGKTGSSLTHHLNPLIEAGYVVKGEVRGTYYVTVEGRLAYRLAQWLTHRIERQRLRSINNDKGESAIDVEFDDEDKESVVIEDENAAAEAAQHLEDLAEELEDARDDLEDTLAEELDHEDNELENLDELDWED